MGKTLCSTCKSDIAVIPNSVIFRCPNCGETTIVRCGRCRKMVIKYKCEKCDFEGP